MKTEKTGSDLTAIEDHVEAVKKQETTVPFLRTLLDPVCIPGLGHYNAGPSREGWHGSLAEAERSLRSCERSLPDRR